MCAVQPSHSLPSEGASVRTGPRLQEGLLGRVCECEGVWCCWVECVCAVCEGVWDCWVECVFLSVCGRGNLNVKVSARVCVCVCVCVVCVCACDVWVCF